MRARELFRSRRRVGRKTILSSTGPAPLASPPDAGHLTVSSDVASAVPAPDPSQVRQVPGQDVAGLPPGIPQTESSPVPPAVKSLIAADSPDSELTGVVDPVPIPQRRFRGNVRRPHFRRPHIRPARIPVRVHTFDSFHYPNYVFLWFATVFSSAGFWLQQVVVGWLAYEVTESAFWTSLALGLDALPILLVGPLGGLLVDNFDRRKLLVFIFGYQVGVTSMFAGIVLTGNLEAWHIFAFIFFMGMSWVISDPARISLIPNIVPKENLINAFALNSMAFSVTRLAAPALGGVLIAFTGPGITLVLEAVLQACAVAVAVHLNVTRSRPRELRLPTVFPELREGVRYVLREPVLVGLFALTVMPSLLVMPSIQGLMPVYAAEVFHVEARGLGLLLSAVGAGSTLGTFVLATKGDIGSKGIVILVSITFVALATAAFSINTVFHIAYLNLMIISGAMMTFFSVSNAVIQSVVADEYRGRVAGLYILTWGASPFGSLAAGFLAEHLGAPHATQIASGTMLLMLALAVWRIRILRKLT